MPEANTEIEIISSKERMHMDTYWAYSMNAEFFLLGNTLGLNFIRATLSQTQK
jgi:hypothetical protein